VRLEADERAIPIVESIMIREAIGALPPTNYQRFEREQVAAVHTQVAADSAFAEMRAAVESQPTQEASDGNA
jgi:hypothetical protein